LVIFLLVMVDVVVLKDPAAPARKALDDLTAATPPAPRGRLASAIESWDSDLFGKSGDDLTINIPITYAEAVFGVDVRMPTPDGPTTLRVPAGTPNWRTLRLRGRGGTRPDKSRGDLLVSIDVLTPVNLTADARKALEDFAAATPPAPREQLGKRLTRT
jgi:molecular chaperone DnaJ